MPKGFYREIAGLLKQNSFVFHRNGKGSHEIWRNEAGVTISVPANLKSRHTANAVLKQAGIGKKI